MEKKATECTQRQKKAYLCCVDEQGLLKSSENGFVSISGLLNHHPSA